MQYRKTPTRRTGRAGFSLVGMLITLVCVVVLFAVSMSALNKAVTGEGSVLPGTVRSVEDQIALTALAQSLIANAPLGARDNRFIAPSALAPDGDPTLDTTANLYSAMIAARYTTPKQLISGNEYNPYVEVDDDYDYTAYQPAYGQYWDPSFMADLDDLSNVSFAHMPLCGRRFDEAWQSRFDSTFPLLGNRGPKDGVMDIGSYTLGADGKWAGHLVFGDGHVAFVETFTPAGLVFEQDGQTVADNIFAMEDGPDGADAVISFTKTMTADGPELQHD